MTPPKAWPPGTDEYRAYHREWARKKRADPKYRKAEQEKARLRSRKYRAGAYHVCPHCSGTFRMAVYPVKEGE